MQVKVEPKMWAWIFGTSLTEEKMPSKLVGGVALGVFMLSKTTIAVAQQNVPSNQGMDLGKWEYVSHCATCHGLTGEGDGPLASSLKKPVPALTTLSKNNGGVFPFVRVYETIDGRKEVMAHGTRDMPIWGMEYASMAAKLNPYYDTEGFVRAKILALTEYVYRLQAK